MYNVAIKPYLLLLLGCYYRRGSVIRNLINQVLKVRWTWMTTSYKVLVVYKQISKKFPFCSKTSDTSLVKCDQLRLPKFCSEYNYHYGYVRAPSRTQLQYQLNWYDQTETSHGTSHCSLDKNEQSYGGNADSPSGSQGFRLRESPLLRSHLSNIYCIWDWLHIVWMETT